jgi:hypothetical protein
MVFLIPAQKHFLTIMQRLRKEQTRLTAGAYTGPFINST